MFFSRYSINFGLLRTECVAFSWGREAVEGNISRVDRMISDVVS